jgi:hypothetical protein
MSSTEAALRRTDKSRTVLLTLIAVVQVAWLAAIVYGVVWFLT